MANSGRNRVGEDRFYSPPAMRRQNQQKPDQEPLANSENSCNAVMTNLDRFMKYATPIVTAQHLPKTSMKGWRNHQQSQPYFVLDDLWESFREWSAYGAGVPLVLNESDYVVQYYTPYLSAIQLFEDPSASKTTPRRRPGEGSDSDSSRGTSSDGSYEAGASGHGPRVPGNNVESIANSVKKLALDEGEAGIANSPGVLVYEYFEQKLPYQRAPLADLVSELAAQWPKLKTYRSCDLAQSSWFSVAWYPIYRIPVGPSLQNVDCCFLTYHSISTPLRGETPSNPGSMVREVRGVGTPSRLSLPIFGLGVYKFKTSDWTQDAVHGVEKVTSLVTSTDNWLRKMHVSHPDFLFFRDRQQGKY